MIIQCGRIKQALAVKTAVLANLTIWKANRTKQSLVKTAVLANSTITRSKQTVKTVVLANSNDLEGQSDEAVACKIACWQIQRLRSTNCKDWFGKFNMEGQSDEAVACKDVVLNLTI